MTRKPITGGLSEGPAVDAVGNPIIDPTQNVTALVSAGLKRQDDLRELESKHIHELMDLRSSYEEKLRTAESARIDAIRSVDVAAVAQAAQVSATQATTLAAQVSASAETLRNTVAASATAAANALAAALQPIQKSIDDLRQAQYQQQGQATQKTEGRDTGQWLLTTLIAGGAVLITIIAGVAAIAMFLLTHPSTLVK